MAGTSQRGKRDLAGSTTSQVNVGVTVEQWRAAVGTKKVILCNRLVLQYMPFIRMVAIRIIRKLPLWMELENFVQEGVIGLMDAIEKFDPERNIKFATYAEFRIKGAILDSLRSMDWVPRSIRDKIRDLRVAGESVEKAKGCPATDEEVANKLEISLEEYYGRLSEMTNTTLSSFESLGRSSGSFSGERRNAAEFLADPYDEGAESLLIKKQLQQLVAEAVDELSENERTVVSLYYYDELTMLEIGKVMGITESCVSQLRIKAIARLRKRVRNLVGPAFQGGK